MANIAANPTNRQLLETLATFVDDGTITPVISRIYPLQDIREAVAYQEQGHVPGKVLITI